MNYIFSYVSLNSHEVDHSHETNYPYQFSFSSFRCFFFSGIHNFDFYTTNCFHHCYFDAAYYIDFVEGSYARCFSFHLLILKEQIIYKYLTD